MNTFAPSGIGESCKVRVHDIATNTRLFRQSVKAPIYNPDLLPGHAGFPNNWVGDIAIDSLSRAWFATPLGVSYKEDVWKVYASKNSPLPDDAINDMIHISKQGIWIASESGLVLIEECTTKISLSESGDGVGMLPEAGNWLVSALGFGSGFFDLLGRK